MDLPWPRTPILLRDEGGAQVPASILGVLKTERFEFLLISPEADPLQIQPFLSGPEGLEPVEGKEPLAELELCLRDFARRTAVSEGLSVRLPEGDSRWFVRDQVEVGGQEVFLVAATERSEDNEVIAVRAEGEVHVPLEDPALLAEVERALSAGPTYQLLPGPNEAPQLASLPLPGALFEMEHEGRTRLLQVDSLLELEGQALVLVRDAADPARLLPMLPSAGGLEPLAEGPLLELARAHVAAQPPALQVEEGGRHTTYVPVGSARVAGMRYTLARTLVSEGLAIFYRQDGGSVRVTDPELIRGAADALAASTRAELEAELARAEPRTRAREAVVRGQLLLFEELAGLGSQRLPLEAETLRRAVVAWSSGVV